MSELIKQENPSDILMAVIETGPETLMLNQEQLDKTITAANDLLAEIKEKGMSDELDHYANRVQVRIKEVVGELKDRRMPLTSRLNLIIKSFTSMESQLDPANPDSVFAQIGKERNAYATKKAEEQKKREQEAARKLAIEQERNRVIGEFDQGLRNGFIKHLTDAKTELQNIFNKITLETYGDGWDFIHDFITEYYLPEFEHITVNIRVVYLTDVEIYEIKSKCREGKFELWGAEYRLAIETLKRELLDKLPGVKKYLEEKHAAELELKRKEEEARIAREAAAKIEDEQKRKEAEERLRLQEIEAENAKKERERLEEERIKKEEADRIRIAAEQKKLEDDNAAKIKAESEVREATSLFDNQLELTGAESATAIESYELVLKSPAAWLHIIRFYFDKAGNKEDVETLGKKSLNQMKTFVEKHYKKTDERIDSPLIEVKPVYKVQARK